MKKIIITAISAFAVIASVIGCQIYDSQTNEVLASAMSRGGQTAFKLQDVTADFNKLCMKLMDNSSDTVSYDAIIATYMSYDKFKTAATVVVWKNISNIAKSKASQEKKNEYKHDDDYVLNDYKTSSKGMPISKLYGTFYKYISDEYEKLNPVPTEPDKYSYGTKKNIAKPTVPAVPKLKETNTESQNDSLYNAYITAVNKYQTDLAHYKASTEYGKYLADLITYNEKREKYIDDFSDFSNIPVVADDKNADETTFTLCGLYADVNKLIWDYNSKK